MTVILFLIVLAVLIFVHELGHFLLARAFGIKVTAFALGFGPKIWAKTKGETTYSLRAIPFGGYVSIFGENPDEESIKGPDSKRSFVNKPKWQQIIVLASGVLFNFIFAWILIMIAFGVGVPASLESYPEYAERMTDQRITITYVEPGSPAENAGLKPGDTITGYAAVADVQNAINASKENGIEIAGKKVVATSGIVDDRYAIGISMDQVGTLRLPFHLSIYEGTRFTLHMMKQITIGLWDLVAGLFTGKAELASVTGPVGIAGLVSDAAQLGFTYLMMFTALISINLGVLNLVPFPALDGGRILFVLIEAVIRRQIKPTVANTVNAVGFALLILLMVVVTYRDIVKIFVK
jgi:regulator of sigma E protease